ncbi:MAG: sugar phosphate nucleotidyltransferase [Candidatus Parcubacteria bacterium]|nr:sugar phosphate nucleotidyltransferase [Candidatus Parcubacteria bacterium]
MQITKQAVIIAAGQSSRFWPLNQKRKALINIAGRPLILHTIEALKRKGIKNIVIVQGKERDFEKEINKSNLKDVKINYAIQKKPIGTGNALLQAEKFVKGSFLLLGPHKVDVGDYIDSLLKKARGNGEKIIFLGSKTKKPRDFGILDIKGGKAVKIIENPKKGREPSNIKTNEIYFIPSGFFSYLRKVSITEDSLIEAFNLFIKDKGAEFIVAKKETISLKYPWDAISAMKIILGGKSFKKYTGSRVKIGKNVVLRGNIQIGKNSIISDNTVIEGPCYIGDNCKVGYGNILRGPVNLENNFLSGSFAEIKNSIIQKGTHIHSGYFGDLVIGENCRFGAGFISANRRLDRGEIKSLIKGEKTGTGFTFFGGAIGNNSRFGARSTLMPGIFIGSNCKIGPGSVILENIPDNSVFYTKFQKIVKSK